MCGNAPVYCLQLTSNEHRNGWSGKKQSVIGEIKSEPKETERCKQVDKTFTAVGHIN